ncbi:MAG: glycosyltransferase family 4 protein [Bryobacteraceae bacterium]|jgi:glycosyltransferase involved in cell wall biosynthesis
MNVLVIAQHYHPEVTAAVNRLTALAEALGRLGHGVTVIAPKPNHPAGRIAAPYRGSAVKVEEVSGVEVHYTWVYTSPRKSVVRRVLYYASFTLMAIFAALRLKGRYDVVFASCPPPLVGVAGWVIARVKRAKFILDVRDMWPGLAIALGELRNPIAIAAARAVESLCYRTADGIIAVTRPFRDEIERRISKRVPVELVPNGALPLFVDAGRGRERTRDEKGWKTRFVVSYVGNVGVCQGLMHVVEAAEILQEAAPDVLFFVQGHGVVKDRLIAEARRRGLRNMSFEDIVPTETAAAAMAASDALLVPLARVPLAAQFVPSKLFDSMAVGRPVLLSVEGEALRILEESQAGLGYRAEDGKALAEAVLELRAEPGRAHEMGVRGREYIKAGYLRNDLSDRMVRFIGQISGETVAEPLSPRTVPT